MKKQFRQCYAGGRGVVYLQEFGIRAQSQHKRLEPSLVKAGSQISDNEFQSKTERHNIAILLKPVEEQERKQKTFNKD